MRGVVCDGRSARCCAPCVTLCVTRGERGAVRARDLHPRGPSRAQSLSFNSLDFVGRCRCRSGDESSSRATRSCHRAIAPSREQAAGGGGAGVVARRAVVPLRDRAVARASGGLK